MDRKKCGVKKVRNKGNEGEELKIKHGKESEKGGTAGRDGRSIRNHAVWSCAEAAVESCRTCPIPSRSNVGY